jgi:hypothetical protein
MAFEDVAKRLRGQRDGGIAPRSNVDPDKIVADAVAANRRGTVMRDLVLGPILIIGGRVLSALGAPAYMPSGSQHTAPYYVLYAIALVVSLLGVAQLVRGLIRFATGAAR